MNTGPPECEAGLDHDLWLIYINELGKTYVVLLFNVIKHKKWKSKGLIKEEIRKEIKAKRRDKLHRERKKKRLYYTSK